MTIERRGAVAIVDDDPSMLNAIQRLLNARGLATETYNSAEAFLARAERGKCSGIVLDINLKGISGIELQRQLVASGFKLPIIFITASNNLEVHERAMAAGGVACLHKPFPAEQLIAAIERYVV